MSVFESKCGSSYYVWLKVTGEFKLLSISDFNFKNFHPTFWPLPFFFLSVPLSPNSVRHSPQTPKHSLHCPLLHGMYTQDYGIWFYSKYYYNKKNQRMWSNLDHTYSRLINNEFVCVQLNYKLIFFPAELLSRYLEYFWFHHCSWQHHWDNCRFTGKILPRQHSFSQCCDPKKDSNSQL